MTLVSKPVEYYKILFNRQLYMIMKHIILNAVSAYSVRKT